MSTKLCREGRASLLMKGSLHTDVLMAAVVDRVAGLRTNRRTSHAFVLDLAHRYFVWVGCTTGGFVVCRVGESHSSEECETLSFRSGAGPVFRVGGVAIRV